MNLDREVSLLRSRVAILGTIILVAGDTLGVCIAIIGSTDASAKF
jgi:hypothetical protein